MEAVKAGHKVYFTTLEDMFRKLSRAQVSAKGLRVFTGCTLLIIDEVGYLPMGAREADMFCAFDLTIIGALFTLTSTPWLVTNRSSIDKGLLVNTTKVDLRFRLLE